MDAQAIAAEARTVLALAAHFDSLKEAATRLRWQVGARERGYFTPSEDDEVRHILVSYWMSRNALLDLVVSCKDPEDTDSEDEQAAFLVAFAGALILVDAARSARELFDESPVIRGKLNEPEPHFGIPAGVYDTIQKSLTDPEHIWRLHGAMHHYQQHREELARLAERQEMGPVMDVILRLEDRLQVPLRELALARLQVRARQVIHEIGLETFREALYAVQECVSRMVSGVCLFPGHRPSVPKEVRQELLAQLVPGDVFITRKEHQLTNYFLPGYWPHAALYLGEPAALERRGLRQRPHVETRWPRILRADASEPRRVVEALKDGVWVRSVQSPLASDALAVLRTRLARADIDEALSRALFHEGKPYDFDFDFTRSDRLVCTEVVYRSYEGLGDIRFELKRRAGRMTLAAEDLLSMALGGQHFDPVAVYLPARQHRLILGAEAAQAIAETVQRDDESAG